MTILEMSLGGGLLIAVILVLRQGLLNRIPKWTFLLLWGVALCRLLIPFTLPSQFSVLNGVAWVVQAVEKTEQPLSPHWLPDINVLTQEILPQGDGTPAVVTVSELAGKSRVSSAVIVYLIGASLCGLFFAITYLWGLRRFHKAEPAKQEFIFRWKKEHHTLFPVQIKTSNAVSAPLAYGLLRPTVLLPKDTNWADEKQLTYILTHEYIHVRRGDIFWKLLLTVALCLHWFNPLMWVMYFKTNQDLEFACDEAVVRTLGLDNRKNYAYALLAAAESAFFPLCTTYTTKNHMEERIYAIMKTKKTSIAAILCAMLLVAGVSAVFATSKVSASELEKADELSSVLSVPTEHEDPANTSTQDQQPAVSPTEPVSEPTQEKDIQEPLTDDGYPVNSKGETYGTSLDSSRVGYHPDLIAVMADNGATGYAFYQDMEDNGVSKDVPVYDVDRNTIVGYFKVGNDSDYDQTVSSEAINERLELVADNFRQMGYSEEQIAQALAEYKEALGWN